ncbi:hypothetical protein RRF57_010567 [Xylaria bambusicola]|uniref:Uncharacterized protein n=1 Tax=Xylaria bambusicola TaxID=326684 RepID=A0AAN7UV74_9PEZI
MLNADCLVHGVLQCVCGLGWMYDLFFLCWTMLKREQIRARFIIPGTPLNDCCVSYWCQCCAIIQHDNEVARRMPKPMDLLKNQPIPIPDMSSMHRSRSPFS